MHCIMNVFFSHADMHLLVCPIIVRVLVFRVPAAYFDGVAPSRSGHSARYDIAVYLWRSLQDGAAGCHSSPCPRGGC